MGWVTDCLLVPRVWCGSSLQSGWASPAQEERNHGRAFSSVAWLLVTPKAVEGFSKLKCWKYLVVNPFLRKTLHSIALYETSNLRLLISFQLCLWCRCLDTRAEAGSVLLANRTFGLYSVPSSAGISVHYVQEEINPKSLSTVKCWRASLFKPVNGYYDSKSNNQLQHSFW